jgi:hypothetical protein
MAFADDLRSFLENRLLAFDAGIDLSAGSPAQTQIIDPILERFQEDPFATDIPTFIQDLMVQTFPELSADNGGLLGDLLSKPFQLLLEPFKRQIELIKLGQSANNADLMADAEADALGANFFEPRNEGGLAGGSVRLYFAQPTTQRVTPDKRVFTASGLGFFPTESFFITSAQMLFNRQGTRYFMDITVRAETQGDDYNIDRGEIIGVEDVAGVVQATNLARFTAGAPRQTNDEYLSGIEDALTERSLVTRRGISTRIDVLFESVRALSVVGAGETGMDRDILTGTGEGFLHLAGKAVAYGDWLFVSEIIFKDDGPDNSLIPQEGDLIRFHLPALTVTSPTEVVEAHIVSVLNASGGTYLFLLDQSLSSGVSQGRFALFKEGFITISGVPGGQGAPQVVPDDQVHLGGHTDVFVRPTGDSEVDGTLSSVTDGDPLLALTDLQINNPLLLSVSAVTNQNIATSANLGASQIKPQIGDLLVIETGTGYAGTYRIIEIDSPNPNSVRLDSIFPSSTPLVNPLRARVVRTILVDLVEPRIPKLPFNTGSVADLNTNVGSTTFTLNTNDIQSFGAVVGDVIRILDGEDAGDYVITDFDIVLGGKGPIVDRVATATNAGLRYEVFTAQTGLTLPLVRIKSLEVLDSTQQGTGIKIPYGDAVDIRPTCDLEGAGNETKVLDQQMFLFPDLLDIWGSTQIQPFGGLLSDQRPSAVIAGNDSRYTQKLEVADGIVRRVNALGSNPIVNIELNLPPFCWNGKRDKLLAFTTEKDLDFIGTPGDHQTSEVANAKIGDTLTLLNGPNQGSYIIKDKRVLGMWGKTAQGHRKVTLIQVDPEMPNDPFRTAVNLIQGTGGTMTATDLMGLLEWCTDFDNVSGFYLSTFLPRFQTQLASLGITFPTITDLKNFFDPLIKSGYAIGPAAKGDFRLYFQEPVSIELFTKDDPTTFIGTTDTSKRFRIDPLLPPAQIFPESEKDTKPTAWFRTLDPNPIKVSGVVSQGRLTTGSFPAKGIHVGDQLEFHTAINDLPARPNMASSWLCATQAGSNVVRLILPPQTELDNFAALQLGQLLFIDSGPDIGAYTITSVDKQDFTAVPPDIRVRINKTLTHSTEDFPVTTNLDISNPGGGSATFAYHITNGNTFPMGSLTGKLLSFNISTDGGQTFPTTKSHTFGAGPFNAIADVVSDCTTNLTAGGVLTVLAVGNELRVATVQKGPNMRLRLASGSTAVSGSLLVFTTPPSVRSGGRGAAALSGGKRIYGNGLPTLAASTKSITLYAARDLTVLGVDAFVNPTTAIAAADVSYLGTFHIVTNGTEGTGAFTGEKFVELDRSANFPATPLITSDQVHLRWVIHTSPDTDAAETSNGGREITDQYVRFRLYEAVPHRQLVSSIPWGVTPHPLDPTSISQIELDGSLIPSNKNYNYKMPYRFTRPGVKRVSSTAMALQREGALYYVDLPVVGLGPGEEMNVSKDLSFRLDGRRLISGYTLKVNNTIFTFSAKEEVDIILPKSVLPVGSTPELDNEFDLAGQNIKVTYDNAPLIDDLQRFFDSPQDRVLIANTLVRHFLPSYVFLDVNYTGGSSEDVVAKDLISYIDNISPNRNVLESSAVVDLVKKREATAITLPIVLVALTHGIDRSIRGVRSEDQIGGDNVPVFKGTFNQSYFIAGPDTSQETTRPDGEQVFLKRT